ncbi:FAD-dependent oxidoreductase [Salsuginibacillus kocurii]|uniref:FAD-dependent oxidoreductase n=1 Tax=Salsuginibacillus kocurii TaxID=427078 RepID=UPI0003713144|nr:FAD-dependent monooxygenase [Salsuginibacillus kocurii]
MAANPHALIVGGGIAGTAMALFLKKIGWTSTILEAYPKRDDIGGGLQMAPNGMHVLDALGLSEKVIASGSVAEEMTFHNQKGKIIGSMNKEMRVKFGQPAVNITRSALHTILVEEVEQRGLALRYNKRLKNIKENGPTQKVTAYFEDGSSEDGDIVIGADGIHSQTRKAALPDSPEPSYVGLQWLAGMVSEAELAATEPDDRRLHMTFGQKGFFGYGKFDEKNDLIMWWVNLSRENEASKEEMTARSTEDIRKELLKLCKGWHAPIEELIEKTPAFMQGNVHDIETLPAWHTDRVVLIGDAAHAVSPNSGQGASLALEDAMYLATLLNQADKTISQLFNQYEEDRRPRVEKIVADGRRMGDGKKEMSPLGAWTRDQMLKVIFSLFAERGNRWIHEYKIPWKD